MKQPHNITLALIATTIVVMMTAPAAAAVRREIRLRRSATLAPGPVRLRDVAEISTEQGTLTETVRDLIVAQSPAPDTDAAAASVGAYEISRALAAADLRPASFDIYGATTCQITGKRSQPADEKKLPENEPIPTLARKTADPPDQPPFDSSLAPKVPTEPGNAATLQQLLNAKVSSLTGLPDSSLKIEWRCRDAQLLQNPIDPRRVKITPRAPVGLGRVRFRVEFHQHPNIQKQKQPSPRPSSSLTETHVTGDVHYLCESWVAARPLRAGQMITPPDLQLQTRRVTSFSDVGLTRADRVVGLEAARSIRAQQVIETAMIRKIQLIQRKDQVEVSAHVGSVQLRFQGQALADGGLGDLISVRNETNGNVIQGRVTAPGRVTAGTENNLHQPQSQPITPLAAERDDQTIAPKDS